MNAMIETFEYREKKAQEEIMMILQKYKVGLMPIIRTIDLNENQESGVAGLELA